MHKLLQSRGWETIVISALVEEDLTVNELIDKTGIPQTSAYRTLEGLNEAGVVDKKIGVKKPYNPYVYILVDDEIGEAAQRFCDLLYGEDVYK